MSHSQATDFISSHMHSEHLDIKLNSQKEKVLLVTGAECFTIILSAQHVRNSSLFPVFITWKSKYMLLK